MSHSLEYDRDGHLFMVTFPVSEIKSDSESHKVTYTEENGTRERRFSKYSEFIKFVNWLHDNNT